MPERGTLWRWDLQNTRRSLLLCSIGALAGLLIAGFGLFTARGTRTAGVPAEDVATVNGVPILRVDYLSQLRALYNRAPNQATREQQQRVLNDMIREELYVQRGLELGLPTDDTEVRSALVTGTEQQVAADTLLTKPGVDELRSYYHAHVQDYANENRMTLSEYVLPATDSTAVAIAALEKGESAARLHLRSSGRVDDGEEFYFAARIHLGAELFKVAEALGDGQISAAIPAADGVHILQMHHNVRSIPADFTTVQDRVLADFLKDKVQRLQGNNEQFLRKRADVQIATDLQ